MGKKYIRVEVCRKEYTDIILEVDEDDERFTGVKKLDLTKRDETTMAQLGAYAEGMKNLKPIAFSEARNISYFSWEKDDHDLELGNIGIISPEEANQYGIVKIRKPSSQIPPPSVNPSE